MLKKNYMTKLIRELQIGKDEISAFYDMAGATKGRYVDISSYLDRNENARLAVAFS